MRIPAFRGELGVRLRYHVPAVYARGEGDYVEIEPGDEALYPRAHWIYVERAHDDNRRGMPSKHGPFEWFVPKPHVFQNIEDAQVVICPRRRRYGASKNWPHWARLMRHLRVNDVTVFAAGAPDSSDTLLPGPAAWEYSRFLDASIEAMLGADLVIATANGLSLLALMCGKPLLLITHRGLVAPGPQVDATGRVLRAGYDPVPMDEFYHPMNHKQAPIYTVDAWDAPDTAAETALRVLKPWLRHDWRRGRLDWDHIII